MTISRQLIKERKDPPLPKKRRRSFFGELGKLNTPPVRIVVRSHKTKDTPGVTNVISTNLMSGILDVLEGVRLIRPNARFDILYSDCYSQKMLQEEKTCNQHTIYIGGTGLMWSVLNPYIQFWYAKDQHTEEVLSSYLFQRASVPGPIDTTTEFSFDTARYTTLFHKTITPTGRVIIALFSPEDVGTLLMCKLFKDMALELEETSLAAPIPEVAKELTVLYSIARDIKIDGSLTADNTRIRRVFDFKSIK